MTLQRVIFITTVSFFLFAPGPTRGAIVNTSSHSLFGRQAQPQRGTRLEDEVATTLIDRVGEPAQRDMQAFKKAGMQEVKPHKLTAQERLIVEAALASLPSLNKRVLERHLHRLSFVDGIPGEGTGLTTPNTKTGLSDITLRASVINESLTAFLTNKERRVFKQDGSGGVVTVTGAGVNAITYVLLHESTHVVDVSCSVTTNPRSPFVRGIWVTQSTLAPSLAAITPKTYFRGADPLPIVKAESVYDALEKTPFASLYATATRQEDLAELVTWYEIYTQDGGNLVIELKDSKGMTIRAWLPLTFPKVRERFADVEELLGSQPACASHS